MHKHPTDMIAQMEQNHQARLKKNTKKSMVALDKYVEHFSTSPLQQYTRQGTSNLAKSACQEVARLVTYAHTTDNQICRQLTPCP